MNFYKLKKNFVNYYAIPVLALTAAGLSNGVANKHKEAPQDIEQVLESGKVRSTFRERMKGAEEYRPLYMEEGIRMEEMLESGFVKDMSGAFAFPFKVFAMGLLGFAGYSLFKGAKEHFHDSYR